MEPQANARQVIDANKYLTLGTVGDDGGPWVTPVYYTPRDYRHFYWVSHPDAVHSRNVHARPRVRIVIFDSSVRIGAAEAVYLDAEAAPVPDTELAEAAAFYSGRYPELPRFGPDQLSGPAPFRLYRAVATSAEVLIRGSDPLRGKGTDSRLAVDLF